MREAVDEATGIASKVVIDWKQQPRSADFRPRITLRDKKGEVITLRNDMEARLLHVGRSHLVRRETVRRFHAGDVLARIPRESSKTRDITGGLPRVAEIVSKRASRRIFAIISESNGRVEFGKDYKTKQRIIVRPDDPDVEATEYLVPKGKHITVPGRRFTSNAVIILLDGNPVPQ